MNKIMELIPKNLLVTEEHIHRASELLEGMEEHDGHLYARSCPLALALKENLPESVDVSVHSAYSDITYEERRFRVFHVNHVKAWIDDFDREKKASELKVKVMPDKSQQFSCMFTRDDS